MNKMLEYQRLDIELNGLKKSNLNSVERSNMSKLKDYIIEAQNKGMQLENDANSLIDNYNDLKKTYDSNYNKVQKITSTDLNLLSSESADEILSQINSLSNELFLLERNINIIITKIKSILKDFEVTKNNIIKAKQKYTAFKSKYESDVKEVTPKIKQIEDKMKQLEPELNPELFAKYKTIKSDKIFPVFVSYNDGHCSGCRVEIPTARTNKLKTDGKIICEQCHRILYIK